jgi:PAS domain S-box-containing protein
MEKKKSGELVIANKELALQKQEKKDRAAELAIANKELAFQNEEKKNRAAELVIANKELIFQNEEKENRAAELIIANKELAFQNEEKENRAAELIIANIELAFQNDEKENRAAELVIANKELLFQNEEKKKRVKENQELEVISSAIKQASLYTRSLLEASLDPLVTISPEGKITDVNEASVKVTGVPRLKLIGTDFSDYFTEPQKAREGYKQVFEKEFVSDYPLTIHHKNGTLTDVLYNASVYKDEKGNVLGVFAAARDVTEQKQASLYARSLLEASLDPLVTISPEGKITDVNEASVKVTGVPRLKLIGTDFSDYFTEPQKAREGYKQVFEKELISDYPLTIHHKNGTLTDVLYNASVYKDEKGNVLGVFAAARDVTEQKQASLYARSLIEASLDPLVTISPEGKITDVNEASVKVTGVPRLKLIGTDFSDYFTEPQKAREGYKQVFEKEFVSDYPLTIHHKNGTLTDVLYNASVYKDEKGNVLGVFAAARDVTAQKAEELIITNKELISQNKEKERQAAVLEIANIELKFQNQEKENRAAELVIANKELAFQNEEKENRAAELVIANKELAFQNEEKEDRAAELVIANEELVFQNQEKENRAAELVIANKELVFQNEEKENRAADLIILSGDLKVQQEELKIANSELHQNSQLLIKQEEKVRLINEDLLLLNQQLEERVEQRTKALAESEKQFRDMMETIPQIAWTNTVDGEVTFYNQRWYNYTGLDYDNSKGWGWLSVIHPDDVQSTLNEYKLILKNNLGGEFQNRQRRTDGTDRWHLVRLMPIKNEDGKVRLWTGTSTDIHELRLLQQQKDDFISIASHELKTPTTSLKASLQLLNRLKNEPNSPKLPGLIDIANKSLEKVIVLIKHLLDASNVNEGQLLLNQNLFTLSHVIEECCLSISIEGIYNIITEGDMDMQVYADAERINQVVINFVTNAVKYAPESKEIRIRIEKVDNMAKVSVIDKGPGIPAEKLIHLFDRYYRADNSGSQYSGLGLGLYISAEIIKKHNGKIGVDSDLGKGSTFWFTLPTLAIATA